MASSSFLPFNLHGQKKVVCKKCGLAMWPHEEGDHNFTQAGIEECMRRRKEQESVGIKKKERLRPNISKEQIDKEESDFIHHLVWGSKTSPFRKSREERG